MNNVMQTSENMSTVATAPTVYGIETKKIFLDTFSLSLLVATAPTVYGIET